VTTFAAAGLEARFRDAEASAEPGHGAVRRRLVPDSRLDLFTEVRLPAGDWALLLHSDQRLDDRDVLLTQGLTCRLRAGTVEVVAAPTTDKNLFCTLLADLVQHLLLATGDPSGALMTRIVSWQRMLGRGVPVGLSPEARVGLYGELLVLREMVLPAQAGAAGVAAWVGPSGAPQDFRDDSAAVEVKTVSHRDPDHCRVHNEKQLDSTDLEHLFLVHQVVRRSSDGVSLADLIDVLRSELPAGPRYLQFENRLLDAGWLDTHRERYSDDRYILTRRRCYVVDDRFPRLTADDLPQGVENISYSLDLTTCTDHIVEERAVTTALTTQVGGGRWGAPVV
jgi:hypothetical protein